MQNVATKVEGNMLWIGIDLSEEHGPTTGGKGINVAKSEGYRRVPEATGYSFNLHVYKKAAAAADAATA